MRLHNIEIPVRNLPTVDPGFIPLGLYMDAFLKEASKPVSVAIERENGNISVFETFLYGETAALIYTSGTVAGVPENLMSSGRTLAVHMYALLNEGLYMEQAYATAVILLIMLVLINALSNFISRKITAKGG